MFLQMKNIDDDNAEAAEMARLEDQSDKDMGEDDNASDPGEEDVGEEDVGEDDVGEEDVGEDDAQSDDDSEKSDDEESFVQVNRKNIDDDNAEAAEMARLEDQSDKDMGEDDS